ncbi:MAG TPA: TetR/AcrR family transcriptional regulator [Gemmataceae bacterium]|nr:TetR/AcrR family transcriptional regulator [Gemmataceae bacterium]
MDERPANPDTAPDLPCVFGASPPGLSDVAQLRREQIMDAAEAIIAQEGIHRLSLKRIEKKVGKMSRGQLTYYFPNKESILLAVHDRMLRRMITAALRGDGPKPMTGRAWDCVQHALGRHLGPDEPPAPAKDLFSLLYTFMAQMGHREDYRDRLSQTYRGWREHVAKDIAASVPEPRPVSPTVAASLFQALVHGLTMQLMVDPVAFDRGEMLAACVRFLAPIFQQSPEQTGTRG